MRKIGFVVDSSFGTKIDDVSIVPITIEIDGKEYVDGEFDPKITIEALENKKSIKTSQPSPAAFIDAYEEQLAKGYEKVICLTVASSLSGTFNSANLAKDMLENENIYVIDTQTINIGSKYILEEALKYVVDHTFEELLEHINVLIERGTLIFSVDELGTLVRSGRLGRAAGFIGSILKVKPILRFKTGVLALESRVRRFNGVLKYITEQVETMVDKFKVIVRITYVNDINYAISMKNAIDEKNHKNIIVTIMDVLTPVVSAHVGLGGMGVYVTYEE